MDEWSVHSHEEGEVGAAIMGLAHPTPWAAPPSYILEGRAPLPCLLILTSWSLLPLLHHHESWLRRSPARVVSPPPPRRRVGGPGGSSTSAAQLERGYGGLRQAVRVTEHGCVTSL